MSPRATLWTAEEAAKATGGKAIGAWTAQGISIDTRSLERGDLFVALKGESRDGQAFVADALKEGAAAVLVSRAPADDVPCLMVGDTQLGLERLGLASRARTQAKIVAVTGSAGKTTTKEMLRLMLSPTGPVAASAASYNNQWGVPLSLARMPRDSAYGVFEIGMNHEGEIRSLVRQVRPHVALITTVAPAHLEYFGSVEAIADAKAEIFEGLESGGAAIIPADNPQYERLKRRAEDLSVKRIASFGARGGADSRLISLEPQGGGQKITADIAGRHMSFTIGAAGSHIAMNAIASLLAVQLLGANIDRAAAALANFSALKGRGARFSSGGIEIIDESYNANPASMAAALDLLGRTKVDPPGRRIAVLGDMLELGKDGAKLHRALAEHVAHSRTDLVFLCGTQMASLWEALPANSRGAYRQKSTELASDLTRSLRAGDVVLVKGSFASNMAAIIDALKKREPATA
jgi:UDP-N-acetylmuramoyl-tripeptide--D-alanyl-D-alanine ligase